MNSEQRAVSDRQDVIHAALAAAIVPMFAMIATFFSMKFWYALPLIVAVSLVYAATRHEDMRPILIHAARTAVWIVGFMAIIFAVLYVVSWWL